MYCRHKERDMICNLKTPKKHNDYVPMPRSPIQELIGFWMRYDGNNCAWDFIQYLIKIKRI